MRSASGPLRLRLVLGGLVAAAIAFGAPVAHAADPYPGTVWTEHYFPSTDGLSMLHADVLRPKGLPDDERTPVILSVSPYFNHADTESSSGPAGPSSRFYDFLEVSDIIERGYTYVMVDLPGFGGSGGCNDWGGIREQLGVKAAVEWAASQEWSTGRVGMMGKSYDAWTGLMGIAQQPKGLAAVVAMEPVFAGYRYLYNNGVRFTNSLLTPAAFQSYDAQPGSTSDDPMYNVNGAPQAWCYGVNYGLQQDDDPNSSFWAERDLLKMVKGARTPLFLTQGFLETNTKPDGAFDFFNLLANNHNQRAWYGQFDHVRGWEREVSKKKPYQMGRDTFTEEMMRFFDRHVKGVRGPRVDPAIEVQDALGRYRAESSWPPADSKMWWSKINGGTYTDDGLGSNTAGIWSVSQKLPHDVWLSGEPVLETTLDAVPRANLVANIYDVDPDGSAVLITRGAHLVRGALEQEIELELYGQDWPVLEGHRIGVKITDADNWWLHVPTGSSVEILEARIGLPFLTYERVRFIEGTVTPRLKSHLQNARISLDDALIDAAERRFVVPAPLRAR
jgi:predicted acyl esterase